MDSYAMHQQTSVFLDVVFQMHDGTIFVTDESGNIIQARFSENNHAKTEAIRSKQTWTGHPILELYSARENLNLTTLAEFRAGLDTLLSNDQKPFSLEFSVSHSHHQSWFELKARRVSIDTNHWIVITEENITPQKQSEQWFNNLYENSPFGIVICELIRDEQGQAIDFIHLEANQATEKNTGYLLDSIICKKASDLLDPDVYPRYVQRYAKVIDTGTPLNFQEHIDIYNRTLLVTVFPLYNDKFFINFIDITERKQKEQALQESEERFSLAMEATNDGLYDWNIQTNTIYLSPGWKRMLGYEDDELENSVATWEKLTEPSDLKRAWKIIEEFLEGKRHHYEVEFRMQHKDGHWCSILSRGLGIFDENGQPLRMVGTHVDITQRKHMERELYESEEKYRTVANTAPYGIQLTDLEGSIVYSNPAHHKLQGCTFGTLIGHKIWDLLAQDEEKKQLQVYYQMLVDKQPEPTPYLGQNRTVDGRLVDVQVNWEYVHNADGKLTGIISIISDVTEQKKQDHQIATYQKNLKALTSELTLAEERLKNTLATRLHDNVSQQLAMLRVKIGMLKSDLAEKTSTEELSDMYDQVGHIMKETKSLTSELSFPILKLYGLIDATEKWVEQEITQKHNIQIHIKKTSKPLQLTEDLTHVVFRSIRELLINVVKHAQADTVWLDFAHDDYELVIKIRDNGIGIQDAEAQPQQGFGILSVSEALQALGGSLQYESETSPGCTAIITAPLQQ